MKYQVHLMCCVAVLAGAAYSQTYTEGPGAPFASISGSGTLMAAVSSCDDCNQSLTLGGSFMWFGDTLIPAVSVSSNGEVQMSGVGFGSQCCTADPVVVGGTVTHPRVALAQEDLNPSSGGNIWEDFAGTAHTIEFENVPFFVATGSTNVQTVLHDNGDVEIRFGSGNSGGNSFASGLEDDTRSPPEAFPVTAPGWGANGIATAWPTAPVSIQFTGPAGPGPGPGPGPPVPASSTMGTIVLALIVLAAGTGLVVTRK